MSTSWTERLFKLEEHGTNVRTELIAGLTTFLTMAYIIFVNPAILGDAGMPKDSVFVATCLIAALGSIAMALLIISLFLRYNSSMISILFSLAASVLFISTLFMQQFKLSKINRP